MVHNLMLMYEVDKHLELYGTTWPEPGKPANFGEEPDYLGEVLEETFGEGSCVFPVLRGYNRRWFKLVDGEVPGEYILPASERTIFDYHGFPATQGSAERLDLGEPLL